MDWTGSPAGSAGHVLALVRDGRATTRAEIGALTGLSRSTVFQRVGALLDRGLLRDGGATSPSTGGRPPSVLAFNEAAGVVLAADLGVTHGRVAVADLDGRILDEVHERRDIALGPDATLDWLEQTFAQLLGRADHGREHVLGIGVGVPGRVNTQTGRAVNPPLMPGWSDYPVADRLREAFGAPALMDNDVNVMALGEHHASGGTRDPLLFVKVATGIGAGVVIGGSTFTGHLYAAGEIGHVRVPVDSDLVCTCGNRGCLAVLASGAAIAKRLSRAGIDASGSRDVVRLVAEGNDVAFTEVREAGRLLGGVLSGLVCLLAPAAIVIGGEMAAAGEPLIAGIREVVYQQSLPTVTRDLQILPSVLGARTGVVGAITLAVENALSPDNVERLLATGASGAAQATGAAVVG
jgi:predicted NBD/HSP70 family sugar kinase